MADWWKCIAGVRVPMPERVVALRYEAGSGPDPDRGERLALPPEFRKVHIGPDGRTSEVPVQYGRIVLHRRAPFAQKGFVSELTVCRDAELPDVQIRFDANLQIVRPELLCAKVTRWDEIPALTKAFGTRVEAVYGEGLVEELVDPLAACLRDGSVALYTWQEVSGWTNRDGRNIASQAFLELGLDLQAVSSFRARSQSMQGKLLQLVREAEAQEAFDAEKVVIDFQARLEAESQAIDAARVDHELATARKVQTGRVDEARAEAEIRKAKAAADEAEARVRLVQKQLAKEEQLLRDATDQARAADDLRRRLPDILERELAVPLRQAMQDVPDQVRDVLARFGSEVDASCGVLRAAVGRASEAVDAVTEQAAAARESLSQAAAAGNAIAEFARTCLPHLRLTVEQIEQFRAHLTGSLGVPNAGIPDFLAGLPGRLDRLEAMLVESLHGQSTALTEDDMARILSNYGAHDCLEERVSKLVEATMVAFAPQYAAGIHRVAQRARFIDVMRSRFSASLAAGQSTPGVSLRLEDAQGRVLRSYRPRNDPAAGTRSCGLAFDRKSRQEAELAVGQPFKLDLELRLKGHLWLFNQGRFLADRPRLLFPFAEQLAGTGAAADALAERIARTGRLVYSDSFSDLAFPLQVFAGTGHRQGDREVFVAILTKSFVPLVRLSADEPGRDEIGVDLINTQTETNHDPGILDLQALNGIPPEEWRCGLVEFRVDDTP